MMLYNQLKDGPSYWVLAQNRLFFSKTNYHAVVFALQNVSSFTRAAPIWRMRYKRTFVEY
jgi:hypothetical protein